MMYYSKVFQKCIIYYSKVFQMRSLSMYHKSVPEVRIARGLRRIMNHLAEQDLLVYDDEQEGGVGSFLYLSTPWGVCGRADMR